MSVRMPHDLASEVEDLATETGKSKSFVIIEAVKEYVTKESWQIQDIKDALVEAKRGDIYQRNRNE